MARSRWPCIASAEGAAWGASSCAAAGLRSELVSPLDLEDAETGDGHHLIEVSFVLETIVDEPREGATAAIDGHQDVGAHERPTNIHVHVDTLGLVRELARPKEVAIRLGAC